MRYEPALFDTATFDDAIVDLGPYEVDAPIERMTIRRGQPAQAARDHLTGDEIGKLAVAGAATGTAIAFIIDPAGAAAALLSIVGL